MIRVILGVIAIMLAGYSCTEDRMFATCKFDQSIKANCKTDDMLACVNFSCAVPEHPECLDMTCLSYEGATPRCTTACDPAAEDCPAGSKCEQYSLKDGVAAYACVQEEDIEAELYKDCALNAAICEQDYGSDLCAAFGMDNVCTKACDNICPKGELCSEYNAEFFCMVDCTVDDGVCADDEACITYSGNHSYCFPKCDSADLPDCYEDGGVIYRVPQLDSCNPHNGCPGRSFCLQYGNKGFFCHPCDHAVSLF